MSLSPTELYGIIANTARQADLNGYWLEDNEISTNVAEHIFRFLSVLTAADGKAASMELEVFDTLVGGQSNYVDLRNAVDASASDTADDLTAFLGETPAYFQAIIDMDTVEDTTHSRDVLAALTGLGLSVITADGSQEDTEISILLDHVNVLRDSIEAAGLRASTHV